MLQEYQKLMKLRKSFTQTVYWYETSISCFPSGTTIVTPVNMAIENYQNIH